MPNVQHCITPTNTQHVLDVKKNYTLIEDLKLVEQTKPNALNSTGPAVVMDNYCMHTLYRIIDLDDNSIRANGIPTLDIAVETVSIYEREDLGRRLNRWEIQSYTVKHDSSEE